MCIRDRYIAIIVAFFHKTGAIQAFSDWVHSKNLKRRGVQLMAWFLGIFVYFSDSFSPLFVGTVMRDISDRAKISKEKLSYIADSTAAPVSVLVPITGWAAYLMGLAVGIGCIATQEDAQGLFLKAIPLNFYPLFAVIMVGLVASGIVKDFGPMKKAEEMCIRDRSNGMEIRMEHPQQIEPEQVGVQTGDYVIIKGTPSVNMVNSPEVEGCLLYTSFSCAGRWSPGRSQRPRPGLCCRPSPWTCCTA